VATPLHKKIATAAQLRAARALLNWSQNDLAEVSMVSRTAIAEIEREAREPHNRTLRDLIQAFEFAGVEFIEEDTGGRGVRFRHPGDPPIDPQERLRLVGLLRRSRR
jgi:transcriptional regulator with XRE-family HTH domain